MQTDLETLNSQPNTDQSVAPSQPKREHRGHGKIAQLPKALRDQINQMLDDGISYPAIIERLEASGAEFPRGHLNDMNLSRWHNNGYQRYLRKQERLVEVRANREAAVDMVNDGDTTTLPEADLQVIASQFYDLLDEIQTSLLKQKIAEDPLHYTRFLNAFARLTREILKLKLHRDQREKEKAAQAHQLDPTRPPGQGQSAALMKLWDNFFLGPDYDPMAHPLHQAQPSAEPASASNQPTTTNNQPIP